MWIFALSLNRNLNNLGLFSIYGGHRTGDQTYFFSHNHPWRWSPLFCVLWFFQVHIQTPDYFFYYFPQNHDHCGQVLFKSGICICPGGALTNISFDFLILVITSLWALIGYKVSNSRKGNISWFPFPQVNSSALRTWETRELHQNISFSGVGKDKYKLLN